ncbi:MAG: helix-turn-helix domain-containing protein [Cellulosilyticaceae bacterium]
MDIKDIILCRLEFCPSYIYDEHKHRTYELNYIQSGRCVMVVEDKNIALRAGDCLLMPPNIRHHFMVDCSCKCQLIQFSFKIEHLAVSCSELNCFTLEQPFFKITHCTDVLQVLQQLHSYRNAKEYAMYQNQLFNLEVQKLFVLIALHIERGNEIEHQYEMTLLRGIVNELDCHYDQEINLETLATKYKISSRYLRTLFMKYVGFSATDYIALLRMEKAKDLLKSTKYTISEIAMDVGYNTVQYFSKVFTQKVGLTPKAFRNQYRIE